MGDSDKMHKHIDDKIKMVEAKYSFKISDDLNYFKKSVISKNLLGENGNSTALLLASFVSNTNMNNGINFYSVRILHTFDFILKSRQQDIENKAILLLNAKALTSISRKTRIDILKQKLKERPKYHYLLSDTYVFILLFASAISDLSVYDTKHRSISKLNVNVSDILEILEEYIENDIDLVDDAMIKLLIEANESMLEFIKHPERIKTNYFEKVLLNKIPAIKYKRLLMEVKLQRKGDK